MEDQIPTKFSCLLSVDGETQLWVGHCLELHVVTSGKTEEQAWLNLKEVVRLHVEHCFTNRPDGLKLRATDDEFKLFNRLARERPGEVRRDKIVFSLIPPPEEEAPDVWIEGAGIETPRAAIVSHVH